MTKPEQETAETGRDNESLKRLGLGMLGGFALLFFPSFALGFTRARMDQGGLEAADYTILGVAALIAVVIGVTVWRLWPAPSTEPEAPRVKNSRIMIWLCMGVGALIGVLLVITDDAGNAILSNGTINPVVAGVVIAVWLIFVPIATVKWLRIVDEHEVEAYNNGAFIAGHAYLFIVPAWWMATRAGWLPAQDPMIVFILVCTIWSGVWFAKRYL